MKSHTRHLVMRIPDHWTAWQLEWALDFLAQVERRVWSIFEEHHLASEHPTRDGDDPEHDQLELDLGDHTGFHDDEIPY